MHVLIGSNVMHPDRIVNRVNGDVDWAPRDRIWPSGDAGEICIVPIAGEKKLMHVLVNGNILRPDHIAINGVNGNDNWAPHDPIRSSCNAGEIQIVPSSG